MRAAQARRGARFTRSGTTAASTFFRAGWNGKQIQLVLGHHSPAFTLSTYIHLVPDDLPDAAFLDAATVAAGPTTSERKWQRWDMVQFSTPAQRRIEAPVSDMAYHREVAGLQIALDEDVAADEVERITKSIAAMAEHSVGWRQLHREADSHADAVNAALTAPLSKLIEADSAARAAITSAIDEQQRHAEQFELNRLEFFPIRRDPQILFDFLPAAGGLQVFGPPFHFMWHWHSGAPAPELAQLDRPTGSIRVTGRTGHNDREITHHAGFGVSLSTDRRRTVTARSLRRNRHFYYLSSRVGGSATAEGGTEMTVMENGQLLKFGVDLFFRKRCSGGESDHFNADALAASNSIEVTWTMLPGSRYEVNVGAWVFCGTQSTLFSSFARGGLDAQVIGITLAEQ